MDSKQATSSSDGKENERFEYVDGICWVSEWGFHNLRFALTYEPESTDLFIVTYPRSGTTWMQNIVYSLLNNGQAFDADFDHFVKQNPYIEIGGKSCIESMQRPGAIKTHLPMHRVPYNSLAKYICVLRNPKDVCVSYFMFYNTWGEVSKFEFNEFFECFIRGYLPFGDYFEALFSVWDRRHNENVLLVCYEEMKSDLRSSIKKIADFINVKLDSQLLEKVMSHASIDYMKDRFDSERRAAEQRCIDTITDAKTASQQQNIFVAEANMKIVRKGEINDWKSFLTPEQSCRIYQRFVGACRNDQELESYWSKWNVFSSDIEALSNENEQKDRSWTSCTS